MKFTIFGGGGFIGRHLAAALRAAGHEVEIPSRKWDSLHDGNHGHLIYAIGLTADFRRRPFETVRAHVCVLGDILERADFASLLYLSSTRVYAGAACGHEDVPLLSGDLYNASKLCGEELCRGSRRAGVRVARVSNVIGEDFESENFVPSLVRAALQRRRIDLDVSLDAEKDYVRIEDVVRVLPQIAMSGRMRTYNVAGGANLSNRRIVERIRQLTGCEVVARSAAAGIAFPSIDIGRLRNEFGYSPLPALEGVDSVVSAFRNRLAGGAT